MKLTQKIVALTGIVAFAATPLFAGTGKTFKETVVVEEEATPWYNASLSTGFDSLYMFRGANVLGSGDWSTYGDALYWTNAAFTWNITDTDSLTIGAWMGFGLGNDSSAYGGTYKEFDASITYAKSIDDLTLSLGYIFYYVFPGNKEYYSNELNVSAAYEIDLGFMSLTPSATYYFNLGPDNDTGSENGAFNEASSFLNLKLAGGIPVYKDIVSLAPYSALNLNFGYNLNEVGQQFYGFNNLEFGVAMPIAINDTISISPYVAYSYAFVPLFGTTKPSTFWGGGNIAFAF